jgi:hypothetical protein
MHVLIPNIEGLAAREIARELSDAGHVVHACHVENGATDCAVLDDLECPLATAPIDVAVEVGSARHASGTGDGALCALTRRVPLVLVDAPTDHPLRPWAADVTAGAGAATALAGVVSAPLRAHTDIATGAVRGEPRRDAGDEAGGSGSEAVVEVRRRDGGLVVELWPDPTMTRAEAERMATHVAQAVRGYDGWARRLDVMVHATGGDATTEP